MEAPDVIDEANADGILAVRRGPGANCSSIGSVVDLLFGSAVLMGVVYAGIAAALADKPVVLVGSADRDDGERGAGEVDGSLREGDSS